MIGREELIKDMERCIDHKECFRCAKAFKDGNAVCNDFKKGAVIIPASFVKNAIELLKEQEAEQSDWISVKERKPVETHSIFWPWYGTKKWSNAMWREQSDKVLVTVEFKDGTRLVTTGETHDGVWHTAISRTLDPVVTHWMQFPELPEGVKWE